MVFKRHCLPWSDLQWLSSGFPHKHLSNWPPSILSVFFNSLPQHLPPTWPPHSWLLHFRGLMAIHTPPQRLCYNIPVHPRLVGCVRSHVLRWFPLSGSGQRGSTQPPHRETLIDSARLKLSQKTRSSAKSTRVVEGDPKILEPPETSITNWIELSCQGWKTLSGFFSIRWTDKIMKLD